MLRLTLFLISIVAFNCIVAAPLSGHANGCKQGCPSSSKGSKLKYLPGQVYSYSFDSTVSISLTGNDPQDIQLQVQGTAQVHAISSCQYGLEVQDVTLIGPDKAKAKFNNKLQLAKTVQFTLSGDKLDSDICASPDDSDVSLNIKRALISFLQLNEGSTEEVDVFGKCHTNYVVTKKDDGYIVTKTRDLNTCSHRETFVNGFITGVFNENSNVKSTPLLSGDYTNELHINKHGIIESAQAVEDYTLVPFSNGEAGVRARVVTAFKLKDQRANGIKKTPVSVPRSLIYETVEKPATVNYKIAKKSLFGICETYAQRKNSVGAQVAGQFTETIRLLRQLKKDDILVLFKEASQLKDNPVCRKVFLDAVFRVATADSVNAIASLLENKQIHEKRLAYLSFNLATSVNQETIRSLTKLLEKEHLKEAYLSIGNLIKKYTQQEGAEHDADLVKLFDKIAEKLGDGKSEKRNHEDLIVAILKGLRGARGVTGSLVDKLIKLSSEGHAGRVRAAAIQAFTSASSDPKIQQAALSILKNRKIDSEFRIEAYLILVDYPTPKIAGEVSKLLEDEPVYQVGSFIVSHLANLRSSTDLYREKARQVFADVRPSKKFPSDLRKYSFNHEVSYEFGSLGLGGSVDSNVIYSQDSFTPRSIRTNFTGELFGTSFNIFEVNGRQENFDLVLERYFGPKGYFNSLNKQETFDKVRSFFGQGDKRAKRGLSQDADNFGKEFVGDLSKDVDFDLSVKMFGSELYFLSLGDNFPSENKDFTKEFGKFVQNFLKSSKDGKKHQYDVHALLLDVEFSYPTSSGFPLKIQSQGAGAFHLETVLKADFKDIHTHPKNTKFAVSVLPSYNVELTGIISVDGYEVSTGVKVTSNLHSATGSSLSFDLLNQGKGVDLKIDFPFKKQEILSFDHKIVFIQQNLGHESIQHNLKSTQKKDINVRSDCFDQFNKHLGIVVCYELNMKKGEKLANSRLFPLNGPAHVSAYVEIEKQYHFNALYDDSNAQKRSLELTFDTPESQSTRKVQIKFEGAIQPKAYLSASVVSPYKSGKAEIGVSNDDKELILYGEASSDDLQYLLKFGFKKGGSGPRREYTPLIEFNNPDAIPYKVSGKLIADSSQSPKTKYTFEKLTVEPAQKDGKFGPLVIDGTFEHESAERFATDLDIKYKENSNKVKGKLVAQQKEFELDASLLSDIHELANGRVMVHYKRTDKQCKNSFTYVYGKDLESPAKRVEFAHEYNFEKEGDKYTSIHGKNTIALAPLNAKFIVNGGIHKNHVDYEFLAEYGKHKIASNLVADASRKSKGDWDVKFNANVNSHGLDITSTRDIDEAAHKSTVKHQMKSTFGTDITLNSKFDNEISSQKVDIVADGTIIIARGQKPLKLDFKVLVSPKVAQTSGKLLADTTEFFSANVVLNRNGGDVNTPITGTLDVTIPQVVTAHGTYNSVKGVGKSELVIQFPKFERKVKVDTKYDRQTNKFDLRNDFYYDFEKDNTRHIVFDTKNKYTSGSFDSVNEVDINGEKFHFEIDATKTGDMKKGKQNGKFLLRLPTQREISGVLDRQVDLTSPKATGHGTVKITETIAQGGRQSRSIELEGTLKDGNREQRFFDVLYKLTLTAFDGKNIIVENHVKHLPKDSQFKTILASLKVGGSIPPSPVEFVVSVDEYCPSHAVYNAEFKYGNAGSIHLNGDYYVGEAAKKPASFKLSGQVAVPQSKLQHLSFDTRGSLKYPEIKDENGQYEYDFKFNSKLNDKDVAIDTKGKLSKKHGDLSLNVKLPEIDSFALDVDYKYEHNKETKTYHYTENVQVRYGNGKNIKFSEDIKIIEEQEISYHGSISTPYEKAKNLDLAVKLQKKDEHTYSYDGALTIDDKKYKSSLVIVLSQLNPSFTLDVYYPPDKHSQIVIVLTRAHDRKSKLSVRLLNINNFQLNGDVELSYQSIENFGIVVDLDAPALKANKLHIDIHSKQNGNNKGVEFSITEQSKNIISGAADYSVKQEKGKTTLDGKGTINWYDKPSALTFQFLRNTFTQAENNETGVSLVFNGQVGPKKVQAELKLTNKQFHLQHTICESDKPCIHLGVNSELSDLDWKQFTHHLLVTVDLRPLGFAHEFNLKADTKRDGYFIDHTFETQIQSADQNKYQFKVYVNKLKSGVELSIPKRTAVIEAAYEYPKQSPLGVYRTVLTIYLDKKNHPEKYSTIDFRSDIGKRGNKKYAITGQLVAKHPSVRELSVFTQSEVDIDTQSISSKMTFDVFRSREQAIVVEAKLDNSDHSLKGFNITSALSLKSNGLGLNYLFLENTAVSYARRDFSYTYEFRGPTSKERFGVYLVGNIQKTDLSVVAFDEDLLRGVAKVDSAKKTIELESTVKLLGSEPIQTHVGVSLGAANAHIKQGKFLSIEAEAAISKALTFKAIGNQKTLLNINIALDQAHILSTDYDVNDKEFKDFLKTAKAKLLDDTKKARSEFEAHLAQAKNKLTGQINTIKENLPDFSKFNAEYKAELEKFSEDLLADKSIKELVELFKKTYDTLNKTVGEILRTLIEHFNQLSKTINEFFKQLYDAFNERILPTLKESYNHIVEALSHLFDELLNSIVNLFSRLIDSLKRFEEDFKKIGKSVNEWAQKVGQIFNEQWTIIRRELEDIVKLIVDYIKSLPGLEVIKEKYNEFVQRIPVSDTEEIKKWAEKALAQLKQWLLMAQEHLHTLGVDSAEDYYGLPFAWVQKNAQFLPQLTTLKFSLLNYVLHEPLPSIKDLLLTYRPFAFNPLYVLPPFPIEGRVVEGEYLFTFSGDQITLPGSCHYVLAKDIVDGNFTVAAKIADHKLQSIAIVDKSGESIEINANGKLSVNDKPAEFPVHERTLFAWRTYYSTHLLSTYGVYVSCKLDLRVCHVHVNGFYFSKLRGLLGKGGYEQYDANTLPNGKIADSTTQFANAYKLHSCPDVNAVENHAADSASSPECDAVFGNTSPLRLASIILDSTKYEHACKHAVANAANKQEAACNIAFGFASYSRLQNIPVRLPTVCQKCEVTDDSGAVKSYEIGERYTPAPAKKADIVFVVDTAIEAKSLTELVNHFISQLRNGLKKDYDTHISVIGYNKAEKYLSHYTTDGKLDIAKFHLAKKPEFSLREEKPLTTGCKHTDKVLQTLHNVSSIVRDDLGLLADGRAFREALFYPFRSNAQRTVIAIRSDVLQHSANPIKLLGAKAVNEISKSMGINVHMLAPTPELKFDNNKEINNVVGFNDKNVLYLPGHKARGHDRQHLQYGLDLGIDMVSDNNGYAFSLTNYNALDTANQRNFLKVAAQHVAQQITKTESVHECICSVHHGLFAREVCRETNKSTKSRK